MHHDDAPQYTGPAGQWDWNAPAQRAQSGEPASSLYNWPAYKMLPGRWDVNDERNREPGEPEQRWKDRCALNADFWAKEDAAAEAAAAPIAAAAEIARQKNRDAQTRWRERQRVVNPLADKAKFEMEEAIRARDVMVAQANAYIAAKRAEWVALKGVRPTAPGAQLPE